MTRAVLAACMLAAGPAAAQPPAPAGPPGEPLGGFTLPEDRDGKQRLAAVTDYLAKASVPWDVVCGTAQQLLDGKRDSFVTLPGVGRVSVKGRVNDLLGKLPPDGKQFYEQTFGPPAIALLKEATAGGYDRAKLTDLSQRFFHTKAGTQAAVLLASLQLDAGDHAEAADGFRRLLARSDANDFSSPWLLARAAAAFKRGGDARLVAEADKLLDRLDRTVPRDGLPVGRKLLSADDLRREAGRPVGTVSRGGEVVAGRYGNPAHTGRGPGGSPFLDPVFSEPLLFRPADSQSGLDNRAGADWVRDKLQEVYKGLDTGRGQVAVPGFFPVTVPGLVVFRGYDRVFAVATKDGYSVDGYTFKAGQVVWRSPTRLGAQALYTGADRRVMEDSWRTYWPRAGSVLVENTQTGALAHDGKRVYCVDDWAVPPAPPQVTQFGGFNPAAGGGGPPRGAGDSSQLLAIDLLSGRLVWTLGTDPSRQVDPAQPEAAPTDHQKLFDNCLFLGPPLAAAGRLFVLFERDGQISLACLDPNRVTRPGQPPEVLWVQELGNPAAKLAADPQRRTHACFPAFADGVLVCPTHAGVVLAVDVNARTLLWARGYAATADPGRQAGEGGPVGFPGGRRFGNPRPVWEGGTVAAVPADRWRAAAPIIVAGKVLIAAPDSNDLQCLDLRTGEPVWAEPRRGDDLYVGGVVDGVVLVVGKTGVRGLTLDRSQGAANRPAEAWPAVPTGTPCGHGVVGTDGVFYLPLADGGSSPGDGAEPQVWAIVAATGAVKGKTAFRRPDPTQDARRALGNLVFHDGLLLSQSADALTAFPLLGLKQDEMARRLAADPNDPWGLFLRGELALDAGDRTKAVADFRAAASHNPPADLRRALRTKLYLAYTELLRADFPAAEGFLPEYEKLCDVTPESDDPGDRRKAADESARRRGVYLALLGRGREKQGRLVDAVTAYLEFAGLGDGKPAPVPGEPVGLVRADVWAEGRVADLMAAAPEAARKELNDRAEAEWQAVRTAGDLPRLRRFVAGYGLRGPAARAAALELAGRLFEAGTPGDRRDATVLLMRLTADPDPAARAAAIDTLAAALASANRPEHAVGLYAVLGREYRDVKLPDGATGGERLAALAADRRLLPHLEPARPPLAGKYTVEATNNSVGLSGLPAVGVRVDGPLLPSLRGVRLTLGQGANGDNLWVLTAADRRTGEEWVKLSDLSNPAGAAAHLGGPAAEPVAQASGHLLLVVLGTNAHCLDLLERKEVWRHPLLGGAVPPAPPAVNVVDGDTEYTFDDGFKLRLGRSTVLRPGYAAVVTRDGLSCLDPATGQVRWVRADVSGRVQVWGDDRHLFVVETAADGKRTSRCLRAADGAAVAGVPDFAPVFADGGRRAVVGRHLLADTGSGTKSRVLQLFDPLTGTAVWSRPLPPGTTLVDSPDPALTGYVTGGGRTVVLETLTGKTLLDAPPAGDVRPALSRLHDQPLLLADADRLFLFRVRQRFDQPRLWNNFGLGGPAVRQTTVNGPAAAFDRHTGELLWHSDSLFVGRTLVTDRFDELPCLVTATDAPVERPGEASRAALVRVEVVDKATGRVRFHQGCPNAGPFFAAVTDPKTQAVEFVRPDVRVRLVPDSAR